MKYGPEGLVGATSRPAKRPGDAASAHPRVSSMPTRTPSSRATSGGEGRRAHAQAERAWPEQHRWQVISDEHATRMKTSKCEKAIVVRPTCSPRCEKAAGKPRLALP